MRTVQQLPALTWIVCRGRVRAVEDGRVECPLRGRVSPELCVGCHHLQATDAERDARLWCAVDNQEIEGRLVPVDARLEDALVLNLLDDPGPPPGRLISFPVREAFGHSVVDLIGAF